MKKFKRVLIANRGEIAIRIIRACSELGIRSVAIYAEEDKYSLFKTKADEAYKIGKGKGPVEAYLNIDEIIKLAVKKGVDAIHPGYGFLSENPEFAEKCEQAGMVFIGPTHNMMDALGDKINSKILAKKVDVPTIPGVEKPIQSESELLEFAKVCGYPLMLKASAGGGGRGMRIVKSEDELVAEYRMARNEALKSFGSDAIFVEKYLQSPKHIEVQILGDYHGNIVHLYERDCSVQRRHQKVIEMAPALNLDENTRKNLCEDAVKIAKAVNYRGAGTVEFLVDGDGKHYFIEMNPRIQVEHTVTEMVTGVDLVQSQILVAQGYELFSDEVGIANQESVEVNGYAIQCRITTEDPHNNFAPDTGKLDVYRTASGFGIRLDGGNGFSGSIITPYYDSLLFKMTAFGRRFEDVRRKAIRALRENRIEGVKTNADFLINVLNHEIFKKGNCDTNFIKDHSELFNVNEQKDQEYKLLKFLGEKIVNETGGVKKEFDVPVVPKMPNPNTFRGTKQILDERGAEGLTKWVKDQNKLLLTDTTMRDAHQSLMATRMRSRDMIKIARATAVAEKDLFSLEMWGGATFDVSYRFLKESPWERLKELRKRVPNVMFQMLLRGSNAVGYKNYPDNVIKSFIKESAEAGIDVYRIFDSLNWLDGMKLSIEEVLKKGKVAEACLCYTGDILDKGKNKYTLDYYVRKAKEIEATGAHILGIKDMSALLKPHAAYELIKTLKQEVDMPIHLHTHDTTGNGVATVLMAAQAGVDIVDTAINSMSGLTSQPALNSIVAALQHTDRETGFNLGELQQVSDYWEAVRGVYETFESGLKSGSAEIYKYEIPGGQYSNLKPQVESFGLGHRFEEVKQMYCDVNQMFGDIVKVTPSSKAVGDMAIFMVQNGLTPENILEKGKDLAFPDSVISYFQGMMGQPEGGFDPELQKMILKGIAPITCRPGELLEEYDFEEARNELDKEFGRKADQKDLLSYALYPKVFKEYLEHTDKYGDFMRMGSDVFFHGIAEGETCEIDIERGKTHVVKLVQVGKVDEKGMRGVVFEVNGNRREVQIKDTRKPLVKSESEMRYADENNESEIGSSIPGNVYKVIVEEGQEVKENETIAILEAMKMETVVKAPFTGIIKKVFISEGDRVESGQLLFEIDKK